MQSTKKILVPIDFSPCSENALAYAMQLATKIKATIHVLNVAMIDIEETENSYVVESIVKEKISLTRQRLDKSLTTVKKNVSLSLDKLSEIETIIEIGSPSLMISEIAKRSQVDLIIMGTQGENSISDRLLGSTASTVVKNASCSLIVIPERALFQYPIIMGYASNLIDSDPFEILRAGKLLEPVQPAVIHCVHFSEKQEYMDDTFDDFKKFFLKNTINTSIHFYRIKTNDKVQGLNDFCIEHNINLMVLYRPVRSFWQALFGKGFTQEMSKHTNVPLLVLREGNR